MREPSLLTTQEVCDLLVCSVSKLIRMVDAGDFPRPFKVGQQNRWRPAVVEEWLKRQERLARV